MRYPTGEESKRGECVGDCRAETWGRGHSLSPCSKVGQGWENTKRSLFNKLDRFLPRLPVAKAWQRYSKRHGRYKTVGMVTARRTAWPLLGGCSALLSGLSPRGVPSQAADLHNVHDTALPMRGGMRSKRKSMLGHCVFTVRLLSLRAAGRTQRRTSCGHASPWRMHRQCFARTCDLRPAASSKSSKDCAPPNDNSENARSMGVQLSVISLYLC